MRERALKHVPTRSLLLVGSLPVLFASCTTDLTLMPAPGAEFLQVTTGTRHACGLTPLRSVLCWGALDPRPTLVSAGFSFTAITTRQDHSCGISGDGTAYCWGINTFGQIGFLGDLPFCGVSGSRGVFRCSGGPVRVDTDVTFQTMGVGTVHTCGLDPNGFAFCWGANFSGELGAVTTEMCALELVEGGFPCSPTPLAVDGNIAFESLSVGASHTCGVTAAGEAYCWGVNDFGRLGDGTLEDRNQPTLVAGNLSFESISAGGSHTCGVTTTSEAYCWGSNSDLQLGTIATDASLACGILPLRCMTTPVAVLGDLRFAGVTTSDAVLFVGVGPVVGGHTCGLTTDGDAYCWGLNESGQLGLVNELRSPVPVRIDAPGPFTQLSAGQNNTCGRTADNSIQCWAFGSPLTQWVVAVR